MQCSRKERDFDTWKRKGKVVLNVSVDLANLEIDMYLGQWM